MISDDTKSSEIRISSYNVLSKIEKEKEKIFEDSLVTAIPSPTILNMQLYIDIVVSVELDTNKWYVYWVLFGLLLYIFCIIYCKGNNRIYV